MHDHPHASSPPLPENLNAAIDDVVQIAADDDAEKRERLKRCFKGMCKAAMGLVDPATSRVGRADWWSSNEASCAVGMASGETARDRGLDPERVCTVLNFLFLAKLDMVEDIDRWVRLQKKSQFIASPTR